MVFIDRKLAGTILRKLVGAHALQWKPLPSWTSFTSGNGLFVAVSNIRTWQIVRIAFDNWKAARI